MSKKGYLQILKKPGAISYLYPFPNIKKRILTNLKKTWRNFLLIPFFKYQKKYTYKS